jgi:hypothetical protein
VAIIASQSSWAMMSTSIVSILYRVFGKHSCEPLLLGKNSEAELGIPKSRRQGRARIFK